MAYTWTASCGQGVREEISNPVCTNYCTTACIDRALPKASTKLRVHNTVICVQSRKAIERGCLCTIDGRFFFHHVSLQLLQAFRHPLLEHLHPMPVGHARLVCTMRGPLRAQSSTLGARQSYENIHAICMLSKIREPCEHNQASFRIDSRGCGLQCEHFFSQKAYVSMAPEAMLAIHFPHPLGGNLLSGTGRV